MMNYQEVFYILYGVVIAFLVQVLYDGLGDYLDHKKVSMKVKGGISIGLVLLILVLIVETLVGI